MVYHPAITFTRVRSRPGVRLVLQTLCRAGVGLRPGRGEVQERKTPALRRWLLSFHDCSAPFPMAQEKPNRLVEWLMLARTQTPVLHERLAIWWTAVREEPRLAWETTAVRYVVYVIGAVVLWRTVAWGIWFISPPPPPDAKPQATTADFHVLCTEPRCGTHFVIHRAFGFDDFPVECPQCKQRTGQAARLCNSPTCDGRWVVPFLRDGTKTCPYCGSVFPN